MSSHEVIRAFFGIDLAQPMKQKISQYIESIKEKISSPNIRWTEPSDLHVTLQFLPAVKSVDIPQLVEQASNLARIKPFTLCLEKLALFPSATKPHVLVVEVETKEVLWSYVSGLANSISLLGYRVENRPFRAHLTLARFKNFISIELNEIPPIDISPILVNEITLFQSKPLSNQSCYTPLARIAVGE